MCVGWNGGAVSNTQVHGRGISSTELTGHFVDVDGGNSGITKTMVAMLLSR